MKDTGIKLDGYVRHKETGTRLFVEYYHEADDLWVGTDENDHDWFFEADDVEPWTKEHSYNKGTMKHKIDAHNSNLEISTRVHNAIPKMVREIVEGHLTTNESLNCQHNVEILDEIIRDLKQYQRTLPSISDLECVNAL
jgi:predicted RNA-binding Zn ribbon-like protein